MKVKAWSNGKNGYGLHIGKAQREKHFSRNWDRVLLKLPDTERLLSIKLTPCFWNKCPHLRDKEIGNWLKKRGDAFWEKGHPPAFELEHMQDNYFTLAGSDSFSEWSRSSAG